MHIRSVFIWLATIPLFLVGCGLGPSMMRADRLTYNDAIQLTDRQELLLNIVRLRYNEGPEFLSTSSISTQSSIDLSAAAGAQFGDDQEQRTSLYNLGGSVGYSERPTITFTPRTDKEFTQQLISPIDPEIIFLLVNYGWKIDRVLMLTSNGINGIRNNTFRETPSKNYGQYLHDFARIAQDLGILQQQGLLEISYEEEKIDLSGPIRAENVSLSDILNANKGDFRLAYQEKTNTYRLSKMNRHLVLRFSRNAFDQPEYRQITKDLNLAPDVQEYRIRNAPGSQIKASENLLKLNELILSTRSVLATMAYLSQGVMTPLHHSTTRAVADHPETKSVEGIISDWFQVKVQKETPRHAALAVPYRGYWYYLEDTDESSILTLGVLNSLMRLKIKAAGAQGLPILTLPVSQ